METTCGCETKASTIANGNTITSVTIALSKSMQWILVMQLLEDAFLRLSILQNKSYPRSERMILPDYICIYNVSIYFIGYIFPMTFPVCFCLALAPPLLEAKSTQCHCLWGAFAEFLTLDFRVWPRRNRTSCFSDHFFSFSEVEVNWSSRLRIKRNISMQVVGSCFCLSSRMLGGAFAQQLDKAVIQDVIHAGIFRYI